MTSRTLRQNGIAVEDSADRELDAGVQDDEDGEAGEDDDREAEVVRRDVRDVLEPASS